VRAAVLGLGALATLDELEFWHLPARSIGCRRAHGASRRRSLRRRRRRRPSVGLTAAIVSNVIAASRARHRAAKLVPPQLADMAYVRRIAATLAMARDLINTRPQT